MRITTHSLLLLSAMLLAVAPRIESAPALHRERIEWCDIWFTDAEKDALPRVLLVGDSITRGYFEAVEKSLEGKAYCGRLTTSRSVCDPVFFQELALVVAQYPHAVIHFNNGLHGWDYTEAEYREGFSKLIATLRDAAPQATLICALTTPVLDSGGMADHATRVPARNAIASELCAASGIAINDLHAPLAGKPGLFSKDGVHLNDEGRELLARQVAGAVAKALSN